MRIRNTVVLEKDANINSFPKLDSALPVGDPTNQFAIGDLHANALKFIHFLIKQQVLVMSEAEYAELVEIYNAAYTNVSELRILERILKKSEYEEKFTTVARSIARFKTILNAATVNPTALVHLIGDELADRGANDYFILLIIKLLITKGIDLISILSNHGAEFICAHDREGDLTVTGILPTQASSLLQLQNLIDLNLVQRSEVDDLVETYYKPTVRVLSYSLSETGDITIYTHAPVGLKNIKDLATWLGVEYADESSKKLAETIDAINLAFHRDILSKKKLHESFEYRSSEESDRMSMDSSIKPLYYFSWARNHEVERPEILRDGSRVYYVHGHDIPDRAPPSHVLALDNCLGKGFSFHAAPPDQRGSPYFAYQVLYSQDYVPTKLDREVFSAAVGGGAAAAGGAGGAAPLAAAAGTSFATLAARFYEEALAASRHATETAEAPELRTVRRHREEETPVAVGAAAALSMGLSSGGYSGSRPRRYST